MRIQTIALISVALTLAFQNCSNVSFGPPSGGSNSVSSLSLRQFQPALAVRAMGCIACHANIQANVVTDFGYGNNYYFYQNPPDTLWNGGSVYGDHGSYLTGPTSAWETSMIGSTNTVYVPQASLPSYVQTTLQTAGLKNVTTLLDYMNLALGIASQANGINPANAATVSQVYIGAPTSAEVMQILQQNTASGDFAYVKSQPGSPGLSGLNEVASNVFLAQGALSCDGDLILNGTLLLRNVQLSTLSGCRIYATQTVFISGTIAYSNETSTSNMQISSSRAISIGLGAYSPTCGPASDPAQTYIADNPAGQEDTVALRFHDFSMIQAYFTRDGIAPLTKGSSILADEASFKTISPLQDAECEAQGQNVGFKHILLNAPDIQSRYTGEISGTLIAEVFIGELGQLTYQYDSVFSEVATLPMLNPSQYFNMTK